MAKVFFRFSVQTMPGTSVKVSGNVEPLGKWTARNGLELFPDRNCPGVWHSSLPIVLPLGVDIEYKYVFFTQESIAWESRLRNRHFKVEHKHMTMEDSAESPMSRIIIQEEDAAAVSEEPMKSVDESVKFSVTDSLIIISMMLPVKVTRNLDYSPGNGQKWNFELINGLWLPVLYRIAMKEKIKFKWVGWPHIWVEDEQEQEELSSILLDNYNCVPLFIPQDLLQKHILFCNGVLFRLFHNIIETNPDTIPQYSHKLWEAYTHVNSRFADKVVELHNNREIIWVHDYQLLLLPSFISRRARETLNIGLYLHVPFPSSEVYRVLPHRDALLHAMLCCDIIGFHSFEYARHFITCCKRTLGIDHMCRPGGYLALEFYGRNIMVRVGHLSVEPSVITDFIDDDDHKRLVSSLQQKYYGKKVLVGIDPLHRLSGITLKLHAFREMMSKVPEDNVVLIQICFPAKTSGEEEDKQVQQEISSLCADINSEFAREVVEYVEKNISSSERYAYLLIADAIVNTSVRDGLCLIPFEYFLLRGERAGSAIVSEFAGTSRALRSINRVNPFDRSELVNAMLDVVIKQQNFTDKMQRDLNYIHEHTTLRWAQNFLTDLKRARKDTHHFQYVAHGMGDKLKVIGLPKHFGHLREDEVLKAYRSSKNRVLIFDHEGTLGTLLKDKNNDKLKFPSDKNLECLAELCRDGANSVFILTGRERFVLETLYGAIRDLGLAAEYGAYVKWNGGETGWRAYGSVGGLWKETAADIINAYVARTEGAVCEFKDSTVTFQYKNAELYFGAWQAKELSAHLEMLLKQFMNECEISPGLNSVEVKPRGINKGTCVHRILQSIYEKKGPIDFVLCIGDDKSDEEMFKTIKNLKKAGSSLFAGKYIFNSFVATVGRKPSAAKSYVTDDLEVTKLLEILKSSQRPRTSSREFQQTTVVPISVIERPVYRHSTYAEVLSPENSEEDLPSSPTGLFVVKRRHRREPTD